ncbi:MAG: peptide deformylase [Nitrospirae bacterium]|nr:peptide deformylase [Nitrospirota bacterium]MCL5238551.1 peptide deformylase [Nitrospirota bacterium]
MAVLEIRKYPEEVLKKKASPVKEIDEAVRRLVDDMVETMYAAPGIGLAAPQVGVSKRIVVIDISSKEEEFPLIVLANPRIIEAEGLVDSEEGCLSVPQYTSVVKRAERVIVKGLDIKGTPVEIEGTGLLARVLQHEIDHLDGVLFVDRLSTIKKEFFKKRYLKAVKAGY